MAIKQIDISDNELISLLKDDNKDALKLIYESYWKLLYLSAHNVLKDNNQAEDIVQEIFVQLWIRRKNLDIKSLKAYLYTAVKYKVISHINSASNKKVFITDEELERLAGSDVLINRLEQKEIKALIDKSIEQLPERCREVFILSRREHLNNKEIAARMGISPKTVENQITIALKHLKVALGDYIFLFLIFFLQ